MSTPIVTGATVQPSPTPAPTRVVRQENTALAATSTPTPVPILAPTALPAPTSPTVEAPLPSPAQLRLDARLRWGKGVPASVRRWAFLIVPAARQYGLDPNLLAAVMTMESNGDPLAWSGADARGLMQILHGPWDPRTNVFRGAQMLAALYAQFHRWDLALAAYNAGPAAVIAYRGIPPYRETRDYVIIVSYLYDLFSHRKLTQRRSSVYRSTLKDLQHFADQRKKVKRLAQVAHVALPPVQPACIRFGESCTQDVRQTIFQNPDPFWPLADVPDPLMQVNPYTKSP
jgi:hypothetical protein